jgi:hypothetical protein
MKHIIDLTLIYAVHITLISTILIWVGLAVILAVLRPHNPVERMVRVASFAGGMLATIGVDAAGLPVSDVLDRSRTSGYNAGLFVVIDAILPALAGSALSWFLVRTLKKGRDIANRVLIFLGTIIVTEFAIVYGQVAASGITQNKVYLPNIAFVVGIVIYMIYGVPTPKLNTASPKP